jgi:hypothetical protein
MRHQPCLSAPTCKQLHPSPAQSLEPTRYFSWRAVASVTTRGDPRGSCSPTKTKMRAVVNFPQGTPVPDCRVSSQEKDGADGQGKRAGVCYAGSLPGITQVSFMFPRKAATSNPASSLCKLRNELTSKWEASPETPHRASVWVTLATCVSRTCRRGKDPQAPRN